MSLIEKIISVNTNLDNDFLYSHKYIMDVVNNYPLIKIDDLIEKRKEKKIRCRRTDPVYSRVIDETLSDLENLKQSEKNGPQAVSELTKIDICKQEFSRWINSVERRGGMNFGSWIDMRFESEYHSQGMINLNIDGLDNLD